MQALKIRQGRSMPSDIDTWLVTKAMRHVYMSENHDTDWMLRSISGRIGNINDTSISNGRHAVPCVPFY
jgi:hypothetical protein